MRLRTLRDLKIGENREVTFRVQGSSIVRSAKLLEVTVDSAGDIQTLLLDRLLHDDNEHKIALKDNSGREHIFDVSGCYATMLVRDCADSTISTTAKM